MTEARTQNVPLAMAALLCETSLLMVIATTAKWFAADVSVQVFLLFRYVFCLPLLATVSLWHFGLGAFVVADRRAFALRSVFGLFGLSFWIFAVSKIEITRATALSQTLPVFITLLAPLILGEKVGIRRWSAVGAGLAGAMILLRPDLDGWLQPGIAYAVAAPFFAALMIIYLRKLGATDSPVKTATLYNLFGAAVFSAWCLAGDFNWPTTGSGVRGIGCLRNLGESSAMAVGVQPQARSCEHPGTTALLQRPAVDRHRHRAVRRGSNADLRGRHIGHCRFDLLHPCPRAEQVKAVARSSHHGPPVPARSSRMTCRLLPAIPTSLNPALLEHVDISHETVARRSPCRPETPR